MKRAAPSALPVVAVVVFLFSYCSQSLAQVPLHIKIGGGGQSGVKKFDKEGPRLAATFNPSDFTIEAVVQHSWPVFFDYEIEQPGQVWLTIEVKQVGSITYKFKRSAGQHTELIKLPSDFTKKPAIAAYSIKAISDDTQSAIPLNVNALAVGLAVGSSGLTQLHFSPREVRVAGGRPATRASYSFSAIRRFSGGARADIRLMSGGFSTRVGSKSFERVIAPGETISSAWNCKKGGKLSLGRHKLFVKAWFTLQDSGSWALAQSLESVMVLP